MAPLSAVSARVRKKVTVGEQLGEFIKLVQSIDELMRFRLTGFFNDAHPSA